jgi:4-amino-4-deoxy-L-arabinose transferase-like glycosyltransferase
MLRAARVSSAVLLALSVAAVFAITRLAARSRAAAWAASLIYATNPAVLLNGRRAMMEGALLCFTALAVLAAVLAVREHARGGPRRGRLTACYAALGITAGFALASKHSAAPVIAAAGAAAALEPLIRRQDRAGVRFGGAHVARVLAAGLLALLVFLALNPAWWSDPLHVPGRVLDARTHLLDGQIVGAKNWGGYYWQANDRVEGLLDQAFFAGPQYYEVPVWREYVGEPIAAYDGSWLAGRGGGLIWGALLIAAFAFGAAQLIDHWRVGPAWVVLLWIVGVALALLALTPFDWQRYYLPLQAPIAVIAGTGAWRIGVFARAVQRGIRKTGA